MRKTAFVFIALALSIVASPAVGEMCTIDQVPAATLLVPYFAVEYDEPQTTAIDTFFSINNASAEAALAHVTLWTNLSQPTIDFDIYLSGYDVVTVSLWQVFQGNIPITADDQSDPLDTISPQGPISADDSFTDCDSFFPLFNNPVIAGNNLERLINGHTGNGISSLGGNCLGLNLGDNVARGYITIDSVSQCSTLFPGDPPGAESYFVDGGLGVANNNNQLWGDWFLIDPDMEIGNFVTGDTLVHIEADDAFNAASTVTGATFYGRYSITGSAGGGADNREPLGTTWGTRYLLPDADPDTMDFFDGTDLIVWRDSTTDNQPNVGFTCGTAPDWYPLNETQVVAFDEEESAVEICFSRGGGVISPPDDPTDPGCFPLETGRYAFGEGDLAVPYQFGWVYLNLNVPPDAPTGDVDFPSDPGVSQSFVHTVYQADGRYSVGLNAIQLTNACSDANPELGSALTLPTFP
ncbi:MAG: hypothetical protein AAGE94_06355 [Acidobacteriota bacterium]